MALLMTRLDKMIEERTVQLVNGDVAPDEYRGRCEAIKTLKDVAQACLEIAKGMVAAGRGEPPNPAVHPTVDTPRAIYRA